MFFSKLALLSVVGSFFMVGCMVGPEEAVSEETISEESQGLVTGSSYDDDDSDHDCGPDNQGVGKVAICHVPPGNPDNAHTICIGKPAVDAHLKNHPGDAVGACCDKCGYSK